MQGEVGFVKSEVGLVTGDVGLEKGEGGRTHVRLSSFEFAIIGKHIYIRF